MCLLFSATCGFKLHPQWVCHVDAAHCGICWFSSILHLQVQKVCLLWWERRVHGLNCTIFFYIQTNLTQLLLCLLVKRKIPWIHVQTEDSQEKDPEVISTVGQNDNMTKVKLSEFPSQKELMEKELEARSRGTPDSEFIISSTIWNINSSRTWVSKIFTIFGHSARAKFDPLTPFFLNVMCSWLMSISSPWFYIFSPVFSNIYWKIL